MIIKTHCEALTSGMKTKLNPRYRVLENHLLDDQSEMIDSIMIELHKTGLAIDSTYRTARKAMSTIPMTISH